MNLSCSLTSSPTGAQSLPTCALNPTSVTIASGGSGTSTLTVNTTAASTTAQARPTDQHLWKLGGGGAVLAALLFFGIPFRRRRWTSMLALLLLVAATGAIGCGGGGGTGGGGGGGGGSSIPATTTGNYTFTVAATDSANTKITASTTISVTVQ
jgi:peptidoglycan/LPS O-acetylase OafA/YrhL